MKRPVELLLRGLALALGVGLFVVVAVSPGPTPTLVSSAAGFGLIAGLVLGFGSWAWIHAWRERIFKTPPHRKET